MCAQRKDDLLVSGNRVDVKQLLVKAHVQRAEDGWIVNTLMIAGYDRPFQYRRKKRTDNFEGGKVDLSYRSDTVHKGSGEIEIIEVLNIKSS